MSLINKLVIFLTVIFSLSTVLCGVSIAPAETIEQSAIDFHTGLAILTVLTSFVTIALLIRTTNKQ